MPSPKAVKILKRTAVGVSIALVAIALLVLNARSTDGRPLFWTLAALVIAGAVEIARMGKLRELRWMPVALLAAFGGIMLFDAAIRGAAHERTYLALGMPEATRLIYRTHQPTAYAWVLLIAGTCFAWLHAIARLPWPFVADAGRALFVLALAVLILVATNDSNSAGADVQAVGRLLALLCASALPLLWVTGRLRELAIVLALVAWLVPPLPGLWLLWREHGSGALVAVLLLSKIGDSAGYYVGSAIGKSHPFPKISPGKTTAGCVASLCAAMLAGGVLAACGALPHTALGIGAGVAFGALVNLAAQAGDILESWIKRRAGVKDSSHVFGPSGGVLDQIDSLLCSVPVAVLVWPWLFGNA